MRVLLCGATGAIGRSLAPQLVEAGHTVVGTTRHEGRFGALVAQGVTPARMDGLDRDSVLATVEQARPDVIVHELTALSGGLDPKHFDRDFALTNRLRTEATDHLLEAARRHGVGRVVAQSYTGWTNPRTGGPVANDDAGLDPDPAPEAVESLAAIRHVEDVVGRATDLDGLVLRYGGLYGPGTGVARDEEGLGDVIRQRKLPIVGRGTGVWSFVHVHDAAAATAAAVERGRPGIYNIVDDDPAPEAIQSLAAIRHVEEVVGGAKDLDGLVLRYGGLYGPGTGVARGEEGLGDVIRQRKLPIVGRGTGVWSFVHVHDAAAATVAAVERGRPGIYNIVDDDPAPVAEWLPALALALGAKPPRRVPVWLARLLVGQQGINLMTASRGSSNAKSKAELGWELRYPSWREGFTSGL